MGLVCLFDSVRDRFRAQTRPIDERRGVPHDGIEGVGAVLLVAGVLVSGLRAPRAGGANPARAELAEPPTPDAELRLRTGPREPDPRNPAAKADSARGSA